MLVENVVPDPRAYVFFVSLPLGLLVFVLPFFQWPPLKIAILSIFAGCIFNFGLYWLYKSLKSFDSSQVIPAISGLVPVFSAGLIYFLTKQPISSSQLVALGLLVVGSVIISLGKKKMLSGKAFYYCALSALLFALGFVLSQQVFLQDSNFWRAIVWIKFGGFFTALFFWIRMPNILRGVGQKGQGLKNGFMIYCNQAIGIAGNILQNYAIAISAAIPFALPMINALQGLQYVFVAILAIILKRFFPDKIKEDFSAPALLRKAVGIILLCFGLAFLAK